MSDEDGAGSGAPRRGWYLASVSALSRVGSQLYMRVDRLVRIALTAARQGHLSGIIFWAALIGICGALTGVGFRASVRLVQSALTGHTAGLVETAELLPWWARIAVPTVGGVLAGTVIWIARRLLHTNRAIDYMEAVAVGNGQLGSRAALLQAASSFFTIGSGGSIGREGPLVQLAAAAASKIGQWTQAPVPRLRSAGRLRRRGRHRHGLQRADCRGAVRRGSGARLDRHGELRAVDRRIGGRRRHQHATSWATARCTRCRTSTSARPGSWRCTRCSACCSDTWRPPFLALLDRARALFRRLQWSPPSTLALGGIDRRSDLRVGAAGLGQRLQRRQRDAQRQAGHRAAGGGAGRQVHQHGRVGGLRRQGRHPDPDAVHGRRLRRAVRQRPAPRSIRTRCRSRPPTPWSAWAAFSPPPRMRR